MADVSALPDPTRPITAVHPLTAQLYQRLAATELARDIARQQHQPSKENAK